MYDTMKSFMTSSLCCSFNMHEISWSHCSDNIISLLIQDPEGMSPNRNLFYMLDPTRVTHYSRTNLWLMPGTQTHCNWWVWFIISWPVRFTCQRVFPGVVLRSSLLLRLFAGNSMLRPQPVFLSQLSEICGDLCFLICCLLHTFTHWKGTSNRMWGLG